MDESDSFLSWKSFFYVMLLENIVSLFQMISNYANLKRMFLALDKHLDGFIAIEDLISVLNHFMFAMSDQLFHQLMERYA